MAFFKGHKTKVATMRFIATIILSVSAFASANGNGNGEDLPSPKENDIHRLLQIPSKKISKTMDLKQKQKANTVNADNECKIHQMELDAGITQPSQVIETYNDSRSTPEGCVWSTDDDQMSLFCDFMSTSIFDGSIKECRDAGAKIIYLEVATDCEGTMSQYLTYYPYCISNKCDTDYQVEQIQIEFEESLAEYYLCENIYVGTTLETCFADHNLFDVISDYLNDMTDDNYYPPGCTSISCDFSNALAFSEVAESCADTGGKIIYLNMDINCKDMQQRFMNLPFCLGESCQADLFAESLSKDLRERFESYYTACGSVDVTASDSTSPVIQEIPTQQVPDEGDERGESRGRVLDHVLSTTLVSIAVTLL